MAATKHRGWMAVGLVGLMAIVMVVGCRPSPRSDALWYKGAVRRDRVVWTDFWSIKPRQTLFVDNRDFYDGEGVFQEDAARQAYYNFLRWNDYEIGELDEDDLFDRIWVTDFGLGEFSRCGMGILFWSNKAAHGFSGMEVIRLPKQTIPEHWATQVGDAAPGPKTVHCRHGMLYQYTAGPSPKAPDDIQATIPSFLKLYTNVFAEQTLKATEAVDLPKPGEKQWKQAGPTGAILTEYSTFTDLDNLHFSNPKVKLKNR